MSNGLGLNFGPFYIRSSIEGELDRYEIDKTNTCSRRQEEDGELRCREGLSNKKEQGREVGKEWQGENI